MCRGGCTGWRWCSCCSARESVKAVVVAVMGRQQGLFVFLAVAFANLMHVTLRLRKQGPRLPIAHQVVRDSCARSE